MGGGATADPLSLTETLRYALEHSPKVDSARKTQEIREREYKSAIARLLPSLDVSTTLGLQNNIPITSTTAGTALLTANPVAPWYSSLGLGVSETLYDNGVSITQLKVASLQRDWADVAFQKARDLLVLEVSSQFYRYSLASALVDVRKQQQLTLDKQFQSVTSQYQQGLKAKNDYLRFKTQVQRSEIEKVTAENTVLVALAELRKLVGAALDSEGALFFAPMPPVSSDVNFEKSFPQVEPALESTYDHRLVRIQEQINDKSVSLAQRSYWPQVSVSSGVTYTNQNFINSGAPFTAGQQLSWNALLTLQYNLWDWGTRRRAVEISELNRDVQGNGLRQGLLSLRAEITSLMAGFLRTQKNYRLSQDLVKLESESTQNLQAKYREGQVSYLDLITGVNSLLDAQSQAYSAYFDALTQLARYQYFEGKIYDSLLGSTREK